MAEKWKVFRDGTFLGFMTAAEIRNALREGILDPFDHVCKENSQITSELVEVDEIFLLDEGAGHMQAVGTYQQIAAHPQRRAAYQQPQQQSREPSHRNEFANQQPSYRGGDDSYQRADARRRKNTKKFYLIDREQRVLGPLSASEVQSLFYRGILEKGVRVQKMGDTKTIPVNTFIAAYSGQRVTALAHGSSRLGRRNTLSLQSSKVLNELYRGISTKNLANKRHTPAVVFIGIVALLAAALFLVPDFRDTDKVMDRLRQRTATEEVEDRPRQTSGPRLRRIKVEPAEKPARTAKKPTRRSRPTRQTRKAEPPVTRPSPPPEPPVSRVQTPRTKPQVEVPTSRPPNTSVVPPPAPSPPPRSSSRGGGDFNLAAKDGQIVTIGPVGFSRVELDACPVKCRLTLTGSSEPIVAVFFKGAFASAFELSPGRVMITGRLKKEGSEFSIFVQNVQ